MGLDIISLDHFELRHERVGRVLYFEAIIADVVQIAPATRYDPAQFGAATCKGDLLLDDNEKAPETLDDFMCYAEQVPTWQPIMDYL